MEPSTCPPPPQVGVVQSCAEELGSPGSAWWSFPRLPSPGSPRMVSQTLHQGPSELARSGGAAAGLPWEDGRPLLGSSWTEATIVDLGPVPPYPAVMTRWDVRAGGRGSQAPGHSVAGGPVSWVSSWGGHPASALPQVVPEWAHTNLALASFWVLAVAPEGTQGRWGGPDGAWSSLGGRRDSGEARVRRALSSAVRPACG